MGFFAIGIPKHNFRKNFRSGFKFRNEENSAMVVVKRQRERNEERESNEERERGSSMGAGDR